MNYYAVDRNDTKNLAECKVVPDHKIRLLDAKDENHLVNELRGANLIFVVADEVWENLKTVAIAAHCAKKVGVPVIFIAGGNFEDAEGEIIFDALIKLPGVGRKTANVVLSNAFGIPAFAVDTHVFRFCPLLI